MKNNNRIILITGASSGIGKALAFKYAELGDTIIALARNIDNLNILVNEITSKGSVAEAFACDVTDSEALNKVVNIVITKYNKIDIAYLNVGIAGASYFDQLDIRKFKTVFDTNVYSVINGFNAIVPVMIKQNFGKIIATGSLADTYGLSGASSYSASKIAISHITESARLDLAQYGIKVILLRPGFVKTSLTDRNQFNMPFIMPVEKAARIIIKGVDKNKNRICFPFPLVIITKMVKLMPYCLFDKFINMIK